MRTLCQRPYDADKQVPVFTSSGHTYAAPSDSTSRLGCDRHTAIEERLCLGQSIVDLPRRPVSSICKTAGHGAVQKQLVQFKRCGHVPVTITGLSSISRRATRGHTIGLDGKLSTHCRDAGLVVEASICEGRNDQVRVPDPRADSVTSRTREHRRTPRKARRTRVLPGRDQGITCCRIHPEDDAAQRRLTHGVLRRGIRPLRLKISIPRLRQHLTGHATGGNTGPYLAHRSRRPYGSGQALWTRGPIGPISPGSPCGPTPPAGPVSPVLHPACNNTNNTMMQAIPLRPWQIPETLIASTLGMRVILAYWFVGSHFIQAE